MVLPVPEFFARQNVSSVYVERAGLVAEVAEAYSKKHGLRPAADDRVRMAAFGIDVQIGFCMPGASLFVPGAVEDTTRTIEWMYRNLNCLSALYFSLDTHHLFQIFHPAWWVDAEGNHPVPFTTVSMRDLEQGRWRPVTHSDASLEYVRKLESTGKYVLTIWPYHTLLGGVSHALVPAMMEAALFHAAARRCDTHFEIKGRHALTENYSVMAPEVTEVGGERVGAFNESLFRALMEYERVYIFGQAKSHCVLSTINDLEVRARRLDVRLLEKLWVLEDAMSPVPAPAIDPVPSHLDFPRLADEAVARWKRAGMHIVRTTEPIVS